jgi:NTE family protein
VSEGGFNVVIGGGGAMAIGVSAGIMLALREAGIDCADAQTLVGTSAGSVVATDVRRGADLDRIADQVCSDVLSDDTPETVKAGRSWPELGRRSVGSAWVLLRALSPVRPALPEPPRIVQRVFPGALVRLGESQDWAQELYPDGWPEGGLWLVAANLDTGRRVMLEADPPPGRPRATLPEALAASCAIPGLYPPVRVGGARLVDGGLRSPTNFDVAAKLPQRAVVCISSVSYDPVDPPVGPQRAMRAFLNRQVLRETRVLRTAGIEPLVLRPGRVALELAGAQLFSGRITSDVVEAAYEGAAQRLAAPDMQRRLDRFHAAAQASPAAA